MFVKEIKMDKIIPSFDGGHPGVPLILAGEVLYVQSLFYPITSLK